MLVPGFTLTVAMTELATRNLVSGTARLAGAAGTFLAIGFGVALGTHIGVAPWWGPCGRRGRRCSRCWTEWGRAAGGSASLMVLLRARCATSSGSSWRGSWRSAAPAWASVLLGAELGTFVGAFAVAAASNAYARALDRPSAVPLVPALLLLVPGALGFRSLSSLIDRQTVSGIEAAFRMTLVAISLAMGLLSGQVLVPPRGARQSWRVRRPRKPQRHKGHEGTHKGKPLWLFLWSSCLLWSP